MSGFGPAPQPPNPLGRELVDEKQRELDQAASRGRDEERAAATRRGSGRRRFRFFRRRRG